jgi:hypothetical protein
VPCSAEEIFDIEFVIVKQGPHQSSGVISSRRVDRIHLAIRYRVGIGHENMRSCFKLAGAELVARVLEVCWPFERTLHAISKVIEIRKSPTLPVEKYNAKGSSAFLCVNYKRTRLPI